MKLYRVGRCVFCAKALANSGAAVAQHVRRHVREGSVEERGGLYALASQPEVWYSPREVVVQHEGPLPPVTR